VCALLQWRCHLQGFEMNLPEYLEADDGGFIHLTGHRVGLHNVARMYADGSSAEMIAAQYPSLALSLIHRVIAFYLENQVEVDAYVLEHAREIDRQVAAGPKAPAIEELRHRLGRMGTTASASE
jgi:uncharacterized protein (DUF433 family)